MSEKETPYEFATAQEADEFKNKLLKEIGKFLGERTRHLEKQTLWLVRGRVLNALFCQHYGMSAIVAASEIEKREQSLTPKEQK